MRIGFKCTSDDRTCPENTLSLAENSVQIHKVESFGVGTVDGFKPERLIVVKTANKKKKLGWGNEEKK